MSAFEAPIPEDTRRRVSETARAAHPAGRARALSEVEDGAPVADDGPSVVRSYD